jgi:DNA-binding MarR family transcriptional regulator
MSETPAKQLSRACLSPFFHNVSARISTAARTGGSRMSIQGASIMFADGAPVCNGERNPEDANRPRPNHEETKHLSTEGTRHKGGTMPENSEIHAAFHSSGTCSPDHADARSAAEPVPDEPRIGQPAIGQITTAQPVLAAVRPGVPADVTTIGRIPGPAAASSASSGPAGTDTARIVGQILKAAHRLRAVLNSHLGQFDLNDVRYTVLQIVGDRVDAGCSQTELADELDQSESSISTLVERMRASGLLYRLRSKSDRRKRVLMLTERGRSLLALADDKHREQMSKLLAAFSDAERRRLLELLERLVAELGRSGAATLRFDREAA